MPRAALLAYGSGMRALIALFSALALPAAADDAVIEEITATAAGTSWTFSVTLRHGDTGWDDYADGWAVYLPDGTLLGERTLFHPHVDEQPFTRSLAGVEIPPGTREVVIRARTNTDGWGAEGQVFTLPN